MPFPCLLHSLCSRVLEDQNESAGLAEPAVACGRIGAGQFAAISLARGRGVVVRTVRPRGWQVQAAAFVSTLRRLMKCTPETILRLRDAFMKSGSREADVVSPAFALMMRRGLLSDGERAAMQRIDPLLEALFLVADADGRIAAEEHVALVGVLRGLAGGRIHEGTLDVLLEGYAEASRQEGRDARLRALSARLSSEPAVAEQAFALVAAVAISDGEIATEERVLMDRFGQWLGLPPRACRELIERLEELA